MPENSKLNPGDLLPEFSLQNQDGKVVSREDLMGRGLILYFFPEAGTPGCTFEAREFNNDIEAFEELGYGVIGVSKDSVEKLKAFSAKQHLRFELLSDPDLEFHKQVGSWGEKHLFGRTYTGVLRSTLVLDPECKVERAMYSVNSIGHVSHLLEMLQR